MSEFANSQDRIWIKPEAFGVEQRVEASTVAAERGMGLRMEVHSGHTEFYADKSVKVGQVAVYASQTYKAWPTYETTLDAPEAEWAPFAWRTKAES
jgi:hypothetical protein